MVLMDSHVFIRSVTSELFLSRRNLLHNLTVHLRIQRLIRPIQEPSRHLRSAQRRRPRLRMVHLLCMGQLHLHNLSLPEPHKGSS
ncbi:hypothetical protein M9458_023386, partial [Cirrhinus mrigala]